MNWRVELEDRPNELPVEHLAQRPERGPRGRVQDIELASAYMHKWASNTHRWNNQAMYKPANEFSFTIDRDTDGSYTFVLSMRDPGVHNWLDPSDMSEGILTLRWADSPLG